jgi:multiple sugar transport system permease protein
MSATAVGIHAGRGFAFRASLRRNRRWALITSYAFLVVFAVFFLIPPYYMVVTSLKSDAGSRT